MSTLLERLDDAGRTGLDLIPGDPLCREAAQDIRVLRKAIVFFLEDGVAEDSPDLNQVAYETLIAALGGTST